MRYLGGKYFIASKIAKHVNGHPGTVYLEPFMGSCWVTAQISYPQRLAGDLHDELVELYHKVVECNWEPPSELSEDLYNDIRANRYTGKHPKELMAFAGFGCAFGGSYFRKYAGPVYAGYTRRSLLRKAKKLKNVRFFTADYTILNPTGCVIYCDPPYSDSYSFRITENVGNGSFDNKQFWETMERWSETNLVYISELDAPSGFDLVAEFPVKSGFKEGRGMTGARERRIERLYCHATKATLRQDLEVNPYEVLGINDDIIKRSQSI